MDSESFSRPSDVNFGPLPSLPPSSYLTQPSPNSPDSPQLLLESPLPSPDSPAPNALMEHEAEEANEVWDDNEDLDEVRTLMH